MDPTIEVNGTKDPLPEHSPEELAKRQGFNDRWAAFRSRLILHPVIQDSASFRVSRGIRIGFIFSLDASDDDNPPATAIANLNLPQALMTPLRCAGTATAFDTGLCLIYQADR